MILYVLLGLNFRSFSWQRCVYTPFRLRLEKQHSFGPSGVLTVKISNSVTWILVGLHHLHLQFHLQFHLQLQQVANKWVMWRWRDTFGNKCLWFAEVNCWLNILQTGLCFCWYEYIIIIIIIIIITKCLSTFWQSRSEQRADTSLSSPLQSRPSPPLILRLFFLTSCLLFRRLDVSVCLLPPSLPPGSLPRFLLCFFSSSSVVNLSISASPPLCLTLTLRISLRPFLLRSLPAFISSLLLSFIFWT